jgi:hypothetical protein
MKLAASMENPIAKDSQERSGLPMEDDGLFYSKVPPTRILQMCLEGLKPYLKKRLADKDYDRFAWLYDRLAKRLGVPPTSSYPRSRLSPYYDYFHRVAIVHAANDRVRLKIRSRSRQVCAISSRFDARLRCKIVNWSMQEDAL